MTEFATYHEVLVSHLALSYAEHHRSMKRALEEVLKDGSWGKTCLRVL